MINPGDEMDWNIAHVLHVTVCVFENQNIDRALVKMCLNTSS